MATRARGGGTGMAVALVVFVLLFVCTLIAAIVVYGKVEETDLRAKEAASALDVYVKGSEHTRDDVKKLRDAIREDKSNASVVGTLMADNEKLRRTISADLPSVRALPEFLKAKKVGDGKDLLSHIETLRTDGGTLTAREAAQKAAKEALEVKIAQLEKEKKEIEDKYRAADADRTTKITEISQANTASNTNTASTIKGLQDAQAAAAEEAKKKIEEAEQKLATKDAEILDLRTKLQRLMQAMNPGGDKGAATAEREIDGTVLSVIPQDNLVTIDLGAKDHILLGLTFEVFDKKTGVTREFGDIRGKATIEVVRVKDTSSECRVVRQDRAKPLLEGDVIANVVYDRYRTYKFYVFGNFDIDNDGRPSPTDTRRIKSLITQWGGIVVDEFSYEVDFLVLGIKPEIRVAKEGEQDGRTPEQIEADAANAAADLKLRQLEGDAKLLRVPVLNQNRLLTLLGFYVRE